MKTLFTTLLVLFIAVGLSAVTELINFDNTSNLTDLFNHGTGTAITNLSTGGLSNSGAASIPNSINDIWTRKTGFAVPAVGQTTTLSAYFKISGNSGYSGIGFAQDNVNEESSARVTSSSALGMMFHGGGGGFYNNASSYPVTWFVPSGDLSLGNWYKVIFTITNQGSNLFDLAFQIWNSDSSGVLGTMFTSQSQTGLLNSSIAGLTTIYPYFTNSGSRSGKMDDFYFQNSEPEPPTGFSGAGAGTLASPYVVTTPGQLDEVRDYLDSNFILGNDINLNVSPYNTGEGWVPIGAPTSSYTVLDLSLATGGSFTMTGEGFEGTVTTDPISLPTDRWGIEEAAMMANFMGGHVQELGNDQYTVDGVNSYNFDLVIGTATTQYIEDIPFTGVFNGNGKTISNLFINRSAGQNQGLFGGTQDATLLNITLNDVSVTGDNIVGGLVANASNTVLYNCHSNGSITGSTNAGGLAGKINNTDYNVISNCSSSGTINCGTLAGGLVAYVYGSTLNSCYSSSSVTSNGNDAGGLVGELCVSNVNNCYATGAITSDGMYVGGLIGFTIIVEITNSYSIGPVIDSGSYHGGLIGYGGDIATGCYWNTETSGKTNASGSATVPGAMGRVTNQMTYPYAVNTYEGWDFVSVWRTDAAYTLNEGYPSLSAPDYIYGIDVPVGEVVVTVTGGNANNGSGYIPESTNLAFVPSQAFTFVGTGILTITITTPAQFGAYWQSGAWHTVSNSGGNVTFVIDFSAAGKSEIPVVLGDQEATLPVELSSFTAIATQQNYVQLNWVTQSETGVFGYMIYRNTTNELSSAEVVSNLITASNTSQEQSYSFTDKEVTVGTWYYWLQDTDLSGSVNFHGSITINLSAGNDNGTPVIPLVTSLQKIYPNPFNPTTSIAFGLAKTENVKIVIYNVRGQLIRTLLSETKPSDTYRLHWDGTNEQGQVLPSGVYYMKMSAGKYHTTQKLVILK